MKKPALIVSAALAFHTYMASAQGTFVYDQQSSSTEGYPGGTLDFQSYQPFGQSFVPALSSVDFIRFYISDFTFPNGPGATIRINLRGNSITGAVLAVTSPVFMPGGFFGYTNFFFPASVSVTPGTTYYFQPFAESGNPLTQLLPGGSYGSGDAYLSGAVQPAGDLWFREGIIVPEPSAAALVSVGIGTLLCVRRLRFNWRCRTGGCARQRPPQRRDY